MSNKILLLIIIALILESVGYAQVDYIQDAPTRIKAADWSAMKTVSVYLTEYEFSPSTLVFLRNIPYKLEIINKGRVKHYFTAESFFKAIAARKVQSNTDGEIKAPYFSTIEVFPGRTLDLYFIPVKKGAYNLSCTIKGHAEIGMIGKIRIE